MIFQSPRQFQCFNTFNRIISNLHAPVAITISINVIPPYSSNFYWFPPGIIRLFFKPSSSLKQKDFVQFKVGTFRVQLVKISSYLTTSRACNGQPDRISRRKIFLVYTHTHTQLLWSPVTFFSGIEGHGNRTHNKSIWRVGKKLWSTATCHLRVKRNASLTRSDVRPLRCPFESSKAFSTKNKIFENFPASATLQTAHCCDRRSAVHWQIRATHRVL